MQQIILQVSNATPFVVKNFDILNADKFLSGNKCKGTWNAGGDFTIKDVTISSMQEAVPYEQVLHNIQKNPIEVGSIYLEIIAGNKQQVQDVYSITSQNSEDQLQTKNFKPFKDAYQMEKGITYNVINFKLGSSTKLTWPTIYPSTVFQISIFQKQLVDPFIALSSQIIKTSYNRPTLIDNLRRR